MFSQQTRTRWMLVNRVSLTLVVALLHATCHSSEPHSSDIFNQRILPIFRSDEPSSCIQCHLSSVDLKNYILPSEDATFVSLRDQNLVDLDQPKESKILKLIAMGERDLDEPAKLIHADQRNAEFEAFSNWIEACCADERLRSLPATEELAKPSAPDEVIRHARKSRIVDSFVRNVWSQRLRCFPCHTPNDIDPENPRHQGAIKKRKEFGEKYGQEMLDRLAIFRETPEQTLAHLIESSKNTPSDRLPLINLEKPSDSLLLLKPMSKLPAKKDDGTLSEPGYLPPNITHNGGLKLHKHDQSYKSIVTWIEDYANIVHGRYRSVEELPSDNWYPSKLVVRLKDAPEEWQVRDTVQLFLYAEDGDGWSSEPIGFTQGLVTPRKMVNGSLFLFPQQEWQTDGEEASEKQVPNGKLPRGRYLVKVFHDRDGKLVENPSLMLDPTNFVGQVEIKKARWREGFRFAEVVSATEFNSIE